MALLVAGDSVVYTISPDVDHDHASRQDMVSAQQQLQSDDP
jgi:hypothetical protein